LNGDRHYQGALPAVFVAIQTEGVAFCIGPYDGGVDLCQNENDR
jgi:hypothetical protein